MTLLTRDEERAEAERYRDAGDREAFIRFMESQRPWLDCALRAWTCGGREDFRDLRQDVVEELFVALRRWRGAAHPSTFVWRVARNVAVSRIRRDAGRRRRERLDGCRRRAEWECRERDQDPAAEHEGREEERLVRRALSLLRAEDRTLLALRETAELSFARIAELLGVSEKTLRVRAFRARKRFERAYREAENER